MIEVTNLNFTYPGNKNPTLYDLNFSVGNGEIFGFLGPSGAGKSTTQNILIGILKNYEGSVKIRGEEIRKTTPDFYEHLGVAFEFPNFYSKFTALENLQYFASMYSGETENLKDLLEMVGLLSDADTRVSAFSKGMRMRLNFCRAFLNHPELVFLDEPTAGLDPVNARKIREIILQKKAEGLTVFLTTHNMEVADTLCDRVGFIVNGKIVLVDSPRALKLHDGKKIVRVEYQENGTMQISDFPLETLGQEEEFLKLLHSVNIETIHTQEASLEDVFIKTTGQQLR